MANRLFQQFRWSLEKKVTDIFAFVTFGAVGAPTLVVAASKGVRSIVRNGAGDFTVTLMDPYVRLLEIRQVFDTTVTAAAPTAPLLYVKAQSVGTVTGGTLRLVFNSAGIATDPATGEKVYLQFIFSNSTAP